MVTIRPLTAADIPAAQRLREQAGWNQTDGDWHRLLGWEPLGCWAAVTAEQVGQTEHVVGTTAVTTYGQRIAWVGMVLVDVAYRRQGIGRALLAHALAYLERRGIQTTALDSTPEGQPLYASLGFEDAFELERWRGPFLGSLTVRPPFYEGAGEPDFQVADLPVSAPERGPGGEGTSVIRPITAADIAGLVDYDARLFGIERGHILGALQAGHPGGCVLAERPGSIVGYALSRPGARAWHLGPLAADDPETASRLAAAALQSPGAAHASELVMDVVRPNRHASRLAESLGLAPVRRFIRMTRGAPPLAVDAERLYTSAGPELG